MKVFINTILIVLLFTSTNVFAQHPNSKEYLELARKCYLKSLESKNHGVRNSTILLVVQFNNQHPDENFEPFIKKFKKLSINDPEIQNRLHAYLALVCLEKPQLMTSVDPNNFENPKEFFNEVYQRLSNTHLALN